MSTTKYDEQTRRTIAKCKQFRAERARRNYKLQETLSKLDSDFASVRSMLSFTKRKRSSAPSDFDNIACRLSTESIVHADNNSPDTSLTTISNDKDNIALKKKKRKLIIEKNLTFDIKENKNHDKKQDIDLKKSNDKDNNALKKRKYNIEKNQTFDLKESKNCDKKQDIELDKKNKTEQVFLDDNGINEGNEISENSKQHSDDEDYENSESDDDNINYSNSDSDYENFN